MQLLRQLHWTGLRVLLQLQLTGTLEGHGGQAVPSVGT